MSRETPKLSRLKLQIICFIIFCLPGGAAVGFSLTQAAQEARLQMDGVSQTGTLIAYERKNKRGLGFSYSPIIEFTHAGMKYKFTDSWNLRASDRLATGTTVPIVFDAANPSRARVDTFLTLYGASVIVGTIALPWLLLGIALVIRIR